MKIAEAFDLEVDDRVRHVSSGWLGVVVEPAARLRRRKGKLVLVKVRWDRTDAESFVRPAEIARTGA